MNVARICFEINPTVLLINRNLRTFIHRLSECVSGNPWQWLNHWHGDGESGICTTGYFDYDVNININLPSYVLHNPYISFSLRRVSQH